MTKPYRSLLVGLIVVLAAVFASTAVAVLDLSAQTPLTLEFRDDTGAPISQLFLASPGDNAIVQVHYSGLTDPTVVGAQISIEHDGSVMSVIAPPTNPPVFPPLCDGVFAGAFAGSNRIEPDGISSFLCLIGTPVGDSESGQILNLLVTRVSSGAQTLTFRTTGNFATKLTAPGAGPSISVDELAFDALGTLEILDAPPATPTPVPTATTPPNTGGGAPPPQPTATPSGPVLVAPGAPENVTVTPIVGGVRLEWTAPESDGGSPITNYRVLVIPTGQIVVVPATSLQTIIRGLDPAISYQFQLNAANVIGTGQGAGLTASVNPLEPLSAPQNVSALLGADKVSAVVSWEAPATTAPITGYIVTSEPSVGSGVEVGAEARSATLTGLAPSTAYRFRVRAKNAAGEGPESDPSNEIITGAPVSGSPGDAPGPLTPSIVADETELASFQQAVSAALGVPITLNGGTPTIKANAGGLMVEFPAEPTTGGSSTTGTLVAIVGNLTVDITNGSGEATITVDDHISITGTASLGTGPDSLQVQITDPQLTFDPDPPEGFAGAGGLVTAVGASFGVEMASLPGSIGLTAEFFDDPADVPDSVISFQFAAAGSSGEIEDPASDIAFIVVVNKEGVTNEELGDNAVTLTVSKAWYDSRIASGKEIFITKVGDDGVPHGAPAVCEVVGDVASCSVLFTGDASGFSLFGVSAVSPIQAIRTAVPSPTAVVGATTTPGPTQQPSPTPAAVPTPTSDGEVEAEPTSTPLSALEPTQPAPTPANPDDPLVPDSDDGGIAPWAVVLLGIVGLGILGSGVGGAYTIYRRRTMA